MVQPHLQSYTVPYIKTSLSGDSKQHPVFYIYLDISKIRERRHQSMIKNAKRNIGIIVDISGISGADEFDLVILLVQEAR